MSEAIRSLIKGLAIAMLLIGCGKSGGSSGGGVAAPVTNACAGPLTGYWTMMGLTNGSHLIINDDCSGYDSYCDENFVTTPIQNNATVQITITKSFNYCRATGSTATCSVAVGADLRTMHITCGSNTTGYRR